MGVKRGARRALGVLAAGYFALAAVLLAAFPLPRRLQTHGYYACVWEDGSRTQETYAAAYAAMVGAEEEGVALARGERRGLLSATPRYAAVYDVLAHGTVAQLLSLDAEGVSALERAALWRTFGETRWYAGEWFAWDGARVFRAEDMRAETVVLSEGGTSLAATGAVRLELRPQAQLSADMLCGSRIAEVAAQAPYACEGNAIYLDTPGGRRLVAGLPAATSLAVSHARFLDEGALLPCTALQSLVLPFAGTGAAGEDMLASLFSDGTDYRVPSSLQCVRICGGRVASDAFYGCGSLREISTCGVAAEKIDPAAFLHCTQLRVLHTARQDVLLPEGFTETRAPCGCHIFTRGFGPERV